MKKKKDTKKVRKQRNTSIMEKLVLTYTPTVNNYKTGPKIKTIKLHKNYKIIKLSKNYQWLLNSNQQKAIFDRRKTYEKDFISIQAFKLRKFPKCYLRTKDRIESGYIGGQKKREAEIWG